jgi:hypothetical protein
MTNEDLAAMFGSLRPWSRSSDFRDQDWENYVRVARRVQQTDSQVVEAALDSFVKAEANDAVTDYTSESKPFLLMRVVFDLPESAPVGDRWQRKGWNNWPKPDEDGRVSLAWPISWQSGKPELVASYEGSEGPPYSAVADYRHLRTSYPFRVLNAPSGDKQ